MLASSTHPNGEAPDVVGPPAVGLGSALLLGGELWCPLPLPLPCAYTGNEKASSSTALAITEAKRFTPRITGRSCIYRPGVTSAEVLLSTGQSHLDHLRCWWT